MADAQSLRSSGCQQQQQQQQQMTLHRSVEQKLDTERFYYKIYHFDYKIKEKNCLSGVSSAVMTINLFALFTFRKRYNYFPNQNF